MVSRWSLIYKVRRPLAADTRTTPMFISFVNPHLIVVGLFGWRVLLNRYGPNWWVLLNRVECWKYVGRRHANA